MAHVHPSRMGRVPHSQVPPSHDDDRRENGASSSGWTRDAPPHLQGRRDGQQGDAADRERQLRERLMQSKRSREDDGDAHRPTNGSDDRRSYAGDREHERRQRSRSPRREDRARRPSPSYDSHQPRDDDYSRRPAPPQRFDGPPRPYADRYEAPRRNDGDHRGNMYPPRNGPLDSFGHEGDGGPREGGWRRGPPQHGATDGSFFESRNQQRKDSTLSIWPPSPRSPLPDSEDEREKKRKSKSRSSKHSSSRHKHKSSSSSHRDRHSSSRHHHRSSRSSKRRHDDSDSESERSDDEDRRHKSKRHTSSHRHRSSAGKDGHRSRNRDEDEDEDGKSKRRSRSRSVRTRSASVSSDASSASDRSRRRRHHRSSSRRSRSAGGDAAAVDIDDELDKYDENRDEWERGLKRAKKGKSKGGEDGDDGAEHSGGQESDEEEVGPQLPVADDGKPIDPRAYGGALRPGEGSAMAAFLQEGKRIPRRGEIGLTPEQIEAYERAGFVMSGSRHRRMNAVRIRKENQVISAEEKRSILKMQAEEKAKKEAQIVSQFREMVDTLTPGGTR